LIELARRSLRARARAPLRHAPRAKRREFWGETAKPPRIAPWGLLFTDPRRRLATREKWLRSCELTAYHAARATGNGRKSWDPTGLGAAGVNRWRASARRRDAGPCSGR